MTSEEIKRTMIEQAEASTTLETKIIYANTVWLAEIAYQLARFNEREERKHEEIRKNMLGCMVPPPEPLPDVPVVQP